MLDISSVADTGRISVKCPRAFEHHLSSPCVGRVGPGEQACSLCFILHGRTHLSPPRGLRDVSPCDCVLLPLPSWTLLGLAAKLCGAALTHVKGTPSFLFVPLNLLPAKFCFPVNPFLFVVTYDALDLPSSLSLVISTSPHLFAFLPVVELIKFPLFYFSVMACSSLFLIDFLPGCSIHY